MLTLDKAVAKVIEQAQERCKRCQREGEFKRTGKWARFVGSYSDTRPDKPAHTCHEEIAAVCNVALAAAKLGYQQGAVEAVGEMTRRTSSVLDASAEVNRLLGPKKAGG